MSIAVSIFPTCCPSLSSCGNMLCDLLHRSGSTPDVRLFNTLPSSARGKDGVRIEGDGKHKANLQDLNCGFRFPP